MEEDNIDFERALLYSMIIVAIIVMITGIIIVIVQISSPDAIAGDDCVYTCGSLPQITNNDCIKNPYGTCTSFRPYQTSYGYFQISDSETSYLTACAGLCDGTPSASGCPSEECTKGNCAYKQCIADFTPTDSCNSLSKPIACANNVVYYPYSSSTTSVYNTCKCIAI